MPELPEVEVLVRHLDPLLRGKVIRGVHVRRPRVLRPTSVRALGRFLKGARLTGVERRGKYLVFGIEAGSGAGRQVLLGHLGMTGRMYLLPRTGTLPKHAAVVFDLGGERFVFEDTRYFGRLTLDTSALSGLGPEPLGSEFTPAKFAADLARSSQPIKVRLLDQSVVAGVGNIYASEALFRAAVFPSTPSNQLGPKMVRRVWRAIRETLSEAIAFGSTVPLDYPGTGQNSGLFYYGTQAQDEGFYEERLRVYDRAEDPCVKCKSPIRRIVQAGRSTFYCPKCQAIGSSHANSSGGVHSKRSPKQPSKKSYSRRAAGLGVK